MFIIDITYKVELNQVDEHLEAHIEYLKEQYANGNFIVSGRKVPRTGGIILSNLTIQKELEEILDKDPFKINNVATYTIVEFVPSMTSKELEVIKA
ncbi:MULTISPECIES: YciI family protein [unclassified Aureispira]|uniref:YciI family protein n=1 Tax=unclassified Aureispira TaxID=2649989 RepID=UPI000697A511|nr:MULTISPECIES: YciI family protein [unclassified Aureispira]WMX13979.1 YciI family protein [Aureispira sp. CCB-E]